MARKTILIIDDDAVFLEMMQDMLLDDYDIAVAEDALYGADLLVREHYDLVILNHQMPVMTGFEFLRLIDAAERFKQIPVLVCSGIPEASEQLVASPNRAFLRKPVRAKDLLEHVKRLTERSSGQIEGGSEPKPDV